MNSAQIKQYLQNNLIYGEQPAKHKPIKSLSPMGLVMPNQSRVWGIDVSHWNRPPVDLKRMKDLYGLSFVIIKGCDGSLNSNYYLDHVASAKLAGVPFGMYVWLYPNSKVSISAQVNTWVARAKADPPPLGVFIDAEWTSYGGNPANPSATDLRTAHDLFKARYGAPATTYTAKGYADQYLIGFEYREELWVASYGGSVPSMPKGATSYKYWQFTSTLDGKQLDPNGNYELDGNYLSGAITPPPPTGETMYYGRNKSTLTNIRTGPGLSFTDIGDLLLNDLVEADTKQKDVNGVDWWHLTKITRGGVSVALPGSNSWAWGTNIEETTPTAVTRTVTVTVKETGWTDGTATVTQSKV